MGQRTDLPDSGQGEQYGFDGSERVWEHRGHGGGKYCPAQPKLPDEDDE